MKVEQMVSFWTVLNYKISEKTFLTKKPSQNLSNSWLHKENGENKGYYSQ